MAVDSMVPDRRQPPRPLPKELLINHGLSMGSHMRGSFAKTGRVYRSCRNAAVRKAYVHAPRHPISAISPNGSKLDTVAGMADYRLHSLSSRDFEHLSQSLLKKHI